MHLNPGGRCPGGAAEPPDQGYTPRISFDIHSEIAADDPDWTVEPLVAILSDIGEIWLSSFQAVCEGPRGGMQCQVVCTPWVRHADVRKVTYARHTAYPRQAVIRLFNCRRGSSESYRWDRHPSAEDLDQLPDRGIAVRNGGD